MPLTLATQALTATSSSAAVPAAVAGPVGNGFVVTPGDLAFILKQIKIAERHTTTLSPAHPCSTLLNQQPGQPSDGIPDNEQVPDVLTSYGLRTVDGSCNNLKAGDENFAASDQVFPRLTKPLFRDAEPITAGLPVGPLGPTSYKQKTGNVVDSQPRTISNLIDDQTSTNPAAVAAAGHPVRTQDPGPSAVPCTTDPVLDATPPVDGVPAGCTPSHKTLFIPNVTTDVGLSPPFNSVFTFFGQFFDHGVDQTVKSGSTVFVPLKADDPLRTLGPDGKPNTGDEVQPQNAFMVLTRAQNQPGPDGVLGTADDVQDASNTDTPWVDQSQTYTSHASHQVFLREYAAGAGTPGANNAAAVATGKLLHGLPAGQTYTGSPDMTGGESTWASVKKQAHDLLGLQLVDADVTNIPMLATDPYGKYLPGPNGLPQYVTKNHGLVEGNLANPVPVPADVLHFDTPFVTDIAHNADPSPDPQTGAVPTPDADNTVQTDFTKQPAGTYDDELLASHASCGDGRCNENIALTSIHSVFHSEHNRLVDYIDNVLNNDTSATGIAAKAAWHATGVAGANGTGSYGYGERLFQAARFVTEMEYQHLVFEEFARKVQPAVRPFHVYSPDINPAIKAEFAHAVYRFGHSMLDDTVARKNPDGTGNDIKLLDAFLNPPALYSGPNGADVSARAGAGSIFMGSADQTGNEIDEFVTETLRNNLLGLPLDLPAINMTRAREAGVPPLNDVRRQIFAQTNDGQLAPYTSWSDFGQHMKHPESLVNFVAAYGTHPTITNAATLAAKRDAARAIVNPGPLDTPPADAADFMFSTGAYASDANGVTTTGLDDVDLWVGGLAEVTNLFGGLLGSTFNYVFQTQLENLQDGDRLYYLARTPGLNLRTQLEGNSFSEMIQRNTDNTNTLKADAFATADCKFQLANITGPYNGSATISQTATPPLPVLTGAGSVNDDPSTPDCDENQLLLQKPDGTIQYRAINKIDPPGINGQSVYEGTTGADRVFGGNDNDTFWGDTGNDVIEGNGGDDIALGGPGNDIITDLAGADVPKGGPGNDAIDAGIGDDIPMGNEGADFINGGANDNESFAGEGNDYVIAGQGADAVFGDGGDDWIEGGTGQDLLQGDHGAPFFDDPGEVAPGNDIFIGQPGENDYDAEGGDDIMAQNAAIDRNAGAGGFDWAMHQYDTVAANDDMMINNNLGLLPIQLVVNRDRWQETEADSGGPFNDVISGTDGVLGTPRLITGGGFTGCDALDQAGVNRIKGLADLLPPVADWVGTSAETASLSATGTCPLTGPVWGEGDILLGGQGSDTITGRTGDEVIDGDKELQTMISVRDASGTELGQTDLMEHQYLRDSTGALTGPTLQAAVFAGTIDPGNLVNVRSIVNKETKPADCGAATPANCDTAVFAGPLSQYTIAPGANGTVKVTDTTSTPPTAAAPATGDGTDTVSNVEQLRFSDQTVAIVAPAKAVITSVTAGNASATVNFTAPADPNVTGFDLIATPTTGTSPVVTQTGLSRTARTGTITGLTNGQAYTLQVRALSQFGSSVSDPSASVTPTAPAATAPTAAPATVTAVAGNTQATVSWSAVAGAGTGGSPITGYSLQVRTGTTVVRTVLPGNVTATTVTGLTNGTAYNFRVAAINAVGTGPLSVASAAVTPGAPATAPSTPVATAVRGAVSGSVNVSWTVNNGGSAVTGSQLVVRNNTTGATVQTINITGAGTTRLVTGLTNGTTYNFRVRATNAVGTSAFSTAVTATPATTPGTPGIGTATSGAAGGAITATANWTAPAVNGGSAITSYTVRAVRLSAAGVVLSTTTVTGIAPTLRTRVVTLPVSGANYRFTVQAVNAVGGGAQSARSNQVVGR